MSTSVQSGSRSHRSDQDSAASAALKVARDSSSRQTSTTNSVLDQDGKLSSASAATSLKYARAQDLPSFPSQGGVKLASAGAAASLATDNQKPFEHWKPEAIPAANMAAMQAKDYKMDPLWQPELSAAGSKAALQAHGNTTSPAIWKAPESAHGLSAAGSAHKSQKPVKPITERDVSISDHRKALLAATGAMSGNRRRSGSAPMPPQTNSSSGWALKAANSTHRANNPRGGDFTAGDPGFEAARVQNMARNNVSRQMYGSAPPVAIEVQEKNRQDMLRASAIAMAKKMYAIQQTHIDQAKNDKSNSTAGARVARNRAMSDASDSYGSAENTAKGYENLQEAATRLAQEKLAKLHDEHAEYRQYYGQGSTTQPRTRLTMRGRRRTTSYDDDDDSDEEQSRKIRSQMSLFNSKLAEVDSKKRQADRDALLQAAHKNVTAQLNKMDEKVFSETGKSSPQQRELWERQARERAQRDSDARMVNVGRVHIGGGKFLDQSEIDAIAKARLQPTLDDISDKAEKQRARDEEIRLEQERIKAEQEKEKQRAAEVKQELKEQQNREKAEERARRAEDRRIQNEKNAEEKRIQNEKSQAEKERLRAEKEEKRKSTPKKTGGFFGGFGRGAGEVAAGTAAVGAGAAGAVAATAGTSSTPAAGEPVAAKAGEDAVDDAVERDADIDRPITPDSDLERETSKVASPTSPTSPIADEAPRSPEITTAATVPATDEAPVSPTKRDSRVKSFFSRFRGKSQTAADLDGEQSPFPSTAATADNNLTQKTTETSNKDEDLARSDSMRDVALAGRTTTRDSSEASDMYGDATERQTSNQIAPVSPIKDTTAENHATPAHFAATDDTAASKTRDRSPSISSMSSYNDSAMEHEATATTITPVVLTAPPTTGTTTTTANDTPAFASTAKPSTEAARTIDSEESRGRPGFRQRLLSKVKTKAAGGSGLVRRLSKKDSSNANTPQTLPRPAVGTNATEWGAETEGALAAGGSSNEESKAESKAPEAGSEEGASSGLSTSSVETEREKEQDKDKEGNGLAGTAREGWAKNTTSKRSQDTEEQEREEARDSFKEETLAPPSAAGKATKQAGGTESGEVVGSPTAGGKEGGSRFVEDL